MQVSFSIHYHTVWGQQLAVVGNLLDLGGHDVNRPLLLQHQGDGHWGATLEVPEGIQLISYKYYLLEDGEDYPQSEWGALRIHLLPLGADRVTLRDAWRSRTAEENALHTAAFYNAIFPQHQFYSPSAELYTTHSFCRFQISVPQVPTGYQLAVLGSVPELGSWDYERPLLMGNADYPLWTTEVDLLPGQGMEYKYGLYDPEQRCVQLLEAGPNRYLELPAECKGAAVMQSDAYFRHPHGLWKGAGVAIPVFSIRSKESLGVGEFSDLKRMSEWAAAAGLQMLQVLPINDTTADYNWRDSYPYSAISVYALHPIYLHLDALPGIYDVIQEEELSSLKVELNEQEVLDYDQVIQVKLDLSRQVYQKIRPVFLADKDFLRFFSNNKGWLPDYAAFSYLRDKYGTVVYTDWPQHSTYDARAIAELVNPNSSAYDEIAFYYFLQYYLDKQLREATQHARAHGIVLKGDLPIGIYRHSVDAWVAPHLYNMDGQAGAPPDPFSADGQNWGFPTYNWEEMRKDNYQWWRQRMTQLSRYFDAYRIDHILGFFRIWQIPLAQISGLMGFFNPAIPIDRSAFAERGIDFDYDRFCKPYIPEYLLHEYFGKYADLARKTFLTQVDEEQYRLRPEFATQRQINNFLAQAELPGTDLLRRGLFDLVANVLFLPVAGSQAQQFHPRIMLFNTPSFKDLPQEQRERIHQLYLDYFYNRQEAFWRERAMEKLPALREATNMLICGEDLGMVPASVPGVMRELGMLSLEIQRMSKNPNTEFLQQGDIPYLSVVSPSTHDMSPIRAWWEEEPADYRQRFYEQELQQQGPAPVECTPEIARAIIAQHLHSPSMWAVFPIQDLLAMDSALRHEDPHAERINVPSDPNHYWQYRLHLSTEELKEADHFNALLRQMLEESGRAPERGNRVLPTTETPVRSDGN